jgi:hypothetical protein
MMLCYIILEKTLGFILFYFILFYFILFYFILFYLFIVAHLWNFNPFY